MAPSNFSLFTSLLALFSVAKAGFSSSSSSNIAIYWGQNSYGQASSQQRLSTYCANSKIDIIPLAFMNGIKSEVVNFANAGDNCTAYAGTQLLDCPQLEADIKTCQSTYGKTILLSLGGATYTEGGFSSASEAETWATNVWNLFGPNTATANRPFLTAVVDGFDFDFEASTQNMAPFAQTLRSLMTAAGGKTYYLSAAPQCVYPDAADNDMLNGAVSFDFIMVQFYNNYCGVNSFVAGSSSQNNFNFQTWDTWAKTVSKNPNVKVLVGVPGNTGGGAGYEAPSFLANVFSYCKQFSSFGGVMVWDMSQVYANSGFLDGVDVALTSGSTGTTTTLATTTTKTMTTTTAPGTGTTGVAQWGQCGGQGYTGPTVCVSPYACTCTGAWWCQCQ